MVPRVFHSFLQFASAYGIEGVEPCPELLPDCRLCLIPLYLSFFRREIFVLPLHEEQAVAEQDAFLRGKQVFSAGDVPCRLRDSLLGADVEELEALAFFLRDSLKKLPPAVGKASYQDDPCEHTVCAVTVAMEIS